MEGEREKWDGDKIFTTGDNRKLCYMSILSPKAKNKKCKIPVAKFLQIYSVY